MPPETPPPLPLDWLTPTWTTPGVGALMTTRQGGMSEGPFDSMNLGAAVGDEPAFVAENRLRLQHGTGGRLPIFLKQVHGIRVVRLSASDAQAPVPHEADASITTEPGIACTVQVADCLPLLFATPQGRAVGGAHAGWRGLAGGVVEATLAALCDAAGCAAADVEVWLGACIGPRAFEVGPDVLLAFGGDPSDPSGIDPLCFQPVGPHKWRANLQQLARDRLQAAGVVRVSGSEACTVEQPSRFFSFRRDGVTGRMVAAIWRIGE
jgi:YfiH family protein